MVRLLLDLPIGHGSKRNRTQMTQISMIFADLNCFIIFEYPFAMILNHVNHVNHVNLRDYSVESVRSNQI